MSKPALVSIVLVAAITAAILAAVIDAALFAWLRG